MASAPIGKLSHQTMSTFSNYATGMATRRPLLFFFVRYECGQRLNIKDYHGAPCGTGRERSAGRRRKFFGLPLSMGRNPIVSFSAPVVTGWDGTICV